MPPFVTPRQHPSKGWIWSILLLVCLGSTLGLAQDRLTLLAPSDPLKAAERQNASRQTLATQRQAIDQLRQEIVQLNAEQPIRLLTVASETISTAQMEQARLDSDAIRLKQEELQTGIDAAKRQIKALRQAIPNLEAQEQLLKNPAKDSPEIGNRIEQLAQLRMTLEQRRIDLQLEQDSLKNLEEWLALLDQRQTLATQWRARLEEVYLQQQAQQRQEAQQDFAARLEGEQQKQLSKAEELRTRLQQQGEKLSEAQRTLLETEIQATEERAKLLRWDIRQAAIGDELTTWEGVIESKDANPRRLQEGIRRLTALRNELREAGSVLEGRLERLTQRQAESTAWKASGTADANSYRRSREILAAMDGELRQRQETVQTQSERLDRLREHLETTYLQRANQDLLAREPPLSTIPGQWSATLAELGNAPRVLAHQAWLSVESAFKAAAQASLEQWLALSAAGVLLTVLAMLGRHYLARIAQRHVEGQDSSFAIKFTYTLARLLRKNLWGVALAILLVLALWEWQVPQPGLGILLTLVLLWIGIKTPLNLAWLLLAAPEVPAAHRNSRLYLLLAGMMLVGGALGTLVILSHLSKLPPPAIRILDTTLMLYWLAVCYPLLRIRRMLLTALAERYAGQLWLSAIRLLTLLLPLALAGAALLALAGYLNLAWLVVQRLLALSGILLIWLLLRGLTNDLIVFLKNVAITRSSYGLLWTQEILAPLNQTLQWLLFLLSGLILLDIYSEQGYTFAFWATVPWEPVLLAVVLALLCYESLLFLGGYLVERTQNAFGGAVIRRLRQPFGLLVPAATAQLLLPGLELSPRLTGPLYHALTLLDIAAIGWLLVRLTSVAEDVVHQHYLLDGKDNLGARRLQTQFQMLRRIVVIMVQLLALAVMMMTFPKIRELGTGLLASAGVAGLVIGVAARPFLENLIAGVQIGLTQPIRIDDVVVVEGEWGRIAEINATHVVVRLWDDRRLIVPLNYFNTKPFQNWTWAGSELLGSAFFHVDYTFPVETGREELKRILDDTPLWDGQRWALQVTDTTDRIMTLRALMSAPDAPTAWDLRCLVRERFITFLQREYPQCLPRTRFSESQDLKTLSPSTLSLAPEAPAHDSASLPHAAKDLPA